MTALEGEDTWNTNVFVPIEMIEAGLSSLAGSLSENEPFEPETINGEYIDYSQYKAVIIPMYSGFNFGEWGPLEQQKVSIADNAEQEVNFAIFGTFKDITITNIENMGDTYTLFFGKISLCFFYA